MTQLRIPVQFRRYITSDARVQGGEPCIAGTRIPTATVHLNGIDGMMVGWPYLDIEAVKAAFRFEIMRLAGLMPLEIENE